MRNLGFFFLLVTALGFAAPEPAYKHELDLQGANGSFSFNSSGNNLGITLGYNYTVCHPVQIGIFPNFSVANLGLSSAVTGLGVTAAATLNFPFDVPLHDALFLAAGAGISYSSGAAPQTLFVWTAWVGKRFRLMEHLTYSPSFQFWHYPAGAVPVNFAINFLSFSALF